MPLKNNQLERGWSTQKCMKGRFSLGHPVCTPLDFLGYNRVGLCSGA